MKPDIFRQTFGANLKRTRKEAELSVLDLAQRSHLPHDFITQVEQGDLHVPVTTLSLLASVLGTNVAAILRGP